MKCGPLHISISLADGDSSLLSGVSTQQSAYKHSSSSSSSSTSKLTLATLVSEAQFRSQSSSFFLVSPVSLPTATFQSHALIAGLSELELEDLLMSDELSDALPPLSGAPHSGAPPSGAPDDVPMFNFIPPGGSAAAGSSIMHGAQDSNSAAILAILRQLVPAPGATIAPAPAPALAPVATPPANRLPIPQQLTAKVIASFESNPAYLRTTFEGYFSYIRASNLVPLDLLQFIGDPALREWIKSRLHDRTFQPFVEDDFIGACIHFVLGEVRDPSQIALSTLLSGRLVQLSDEPAARFTEKFLQITRLLPGESQSSLCAHYLKALRPGLARQCMFTRDNLPWTRLSDLIQFVYAEETRFAASRSYHRPSRDPSPLSPPPQLVQLSPASAERKRKPSDVHHFQLAPALRTSAPPVATPEGNFLHLDVRQCPLRGLKTSKQTPLTDEQKRVLDAWGLCYYCKLDRHKASECPAKSSKGPSK
jgi:hypothetical protein